MFICSRCGTPLSEDLSFCTECGARVPGLADPPLPSAPPSQTERFVQPLASVPPPTYYYSRQGGNPTVPSPIGASPIYSPGQTKTATSKHLILVLGGLLIIAIALIAYFWTRSNSSSADNVAASLNNAIASGRLVTLTDDDAYTYFLRLRELAPQHKALSEVKPRVLTQLRSLGDEIIRKRTQMSLEITTERDWTIASHAYEWAHMLEPNDKRIEARWKYAEGNIAKAKGQTNDARSSFFAAMQLDPSWAVPVNDYGFLFTLEKKYEEAIPHYQKAINLQGDWDIPYNNMGTAFFRQEQFSTAESWYRRSLSVNPKWATPHAWLASIYEIGRDERIPDRTAAAQEIRIARSLYDPNRDKFELGEMQKKLNELEQ